MNQISGLVVNGLSKRYGETQALLDVDITFQPGTIHTVFGENGSGKSTLVKILAGITAPDTGEMILNNIPLNRYHPRNMRDMGIIAVMQEILVAPNRSVIENIFMGYDGLFKRNIPRTERPNVAFKTLSRITETQVPLNQLVERIPLPQQQLVVIARALLSDPQILILDEATAALDFGDRDILFNALKEFIAEGRVVIFISHRMDEVLELSDEVTVLRSGKKVATVPRAEVTTSKLLNLVKPVDDASLAEKIDV